MSDTKTASATGDHYTTRELEALGKYRHLGLMRYKDLEAGFCTACYQVYGVTCPVCGSRAGDHFTVDGSMFKVERPIETQHSDGHNWVLTQCKKCDFAFRVIVQAGI